MELLSHNNLWYGIPLYVEYEEVEYDDEDSGRTSPRTTGRSKRNSPVCRGPVCKLPKSPRRTTSRKQRVKTLVPYVHVDR
jgi:hypothetical protein